MLISYIIPLYNCEPYIERCLDSLYKQGLIEDDFEIIVVNDGSIDKGPERVSAYKAQHSNITLINQSNHGPGLTRNRGVEEAKGDYIAFIDADDEIHTGAFSHILSEVDKLRQTHKPDMIIYEYQNVLMGDAPKTFDLNKYHPVYMGDLLGFVNKFGMHPTSCRQLYRREFLYNFKFNDSFYAEDLQFMLSIYAYPDTSVVYFNLPIYFYIMRRDSITHTYDSKYVRKVIDVYCRIAESIRQNTSLDLYDKSKTDEFVFIHVQSVAVIKLHSAKFTLKEIRRYLQRFNENGILPFRYEPNKVIKLLSYSARHPLFMRLFSVLYRNVYLKSIKR